MKKILFLIPVLALILLITQPVRATDDIVKIGSQFVIEYSIKKDEGQARTFLNSNVIIPEIVEKTPINSVMGVPSPKENVMVSIAYFDSGEGSRGRIAFIWEIAIIKNKITDIRVVYDGSEPSN